MVMDYLTKALRFGEGRKLKQLQLQVDQVSLLEDEVSKIKDEEFPSEMAKLAKQYENGEALELLRPKVFALTREVAKRCLNMRHFDVQIMGGIVLSQGKIAEMTTGEGKTLVATLAIALQSLTKKATHIITVNDYLAKRDAVWMGPIYHMLGIKVAAIGNDISYAYDPEAAGKIRQISRAEAYKTGVVFGTNSEFGFDYLRDNMISSSQEKAQNGHPFAIVDEVDSILIDEARTPLIISGPAEKMSATYKQFAKIAPILKRDEDFEVDEKTRTVSITDSGVSKVEKAVGVENLYENVNAQLVNHLTQSLKAHALFKKDVDYVVKDGEIVIVDEFTGRLMFGRRYSEGLHQAIEAKERVAIREESQTLATITLQNYFRLYDKLAGMTGTAATEADEFNHIYKLETVIIPTNKPLIRNDMPDSIYKTEKAKFNAVVETIVERNKKGQPILLGTVSIAKSEVLSNMLKKRGIKHNVLNAKNHEREAEIISQAGKKGAVTVATNMAGRGVDIVLGGNPQDKDEAKDVKESGGLYVMGTERHESRRIDNQLRGRSGRQGDPGVSQFYISLEDEIMRLFAADKIKWVMEKFNLPEDQPIEHRIISKSIETAQKQVESYNSSIRKQVLEYDDIMNKQREVIYAERDQVLYHKDLSSQIKEFITDIVDTGVQTHTAGSNYPEEWDLKGLLTYYHQFVPVEIKRGDFDLQTLVKEELTEKLLETATKELDRRRNELGDEIFADLSRFVLLEVITKRWTEHLSQMDYLQEGINLRAVGQRDPLVEFKNEAFAMFQDLTANIKEDCLRYIYRADVVEEKHHSMLDEAVYGKAEYNALEDGQGGSSNNSGNMPYVAPTKVGRNDPCPCGKINPGTGKPLKYKKCCGKNAS